MQQIQDFTAKRFVELKLIGFYLILAESAFSVLMPSEDGLHYLYYDSHRRTLDGEYVHDLHSETSVGGILANPQDILHHMLAYERASDKTSFRPYSSTSKLTCYAIRLNRRSRAQLQWMVCHSGDTIAVAVELKEEGENQEAQEEPPLQTPVESSSSRPSICDMVQ